MKTVIIIYMLIHLTSVASAEVYSWEDANGINFTDSPSSMPEKYREKAIDETAAQGTPTAPPVRIALAQQRRLAITRDYQSAVHQADLARQNQAAPTAGQRGTRASAAGTKFDKETFPSLASLVVVWFVIALFLIIAWGYTVADIVRSRFITPTIKTAWMLLVICIPLVGMEFYYILGLSQKSISNSCGKNQIYGTHARVT